MSAGDTLIILTPGFAANEADDCLPAQEAFIRALNADFPALGVIILSFHYPYSSPKYYSWHGNRVIAFGGKMDNKLLSPLLWLRVWRELRALKKAHSILGIFSFFCSESAFVGHHFAKQNGLKHFIWILGQDAKKENRQVRRIRPAADELVAISDFLVDSFHKNHGIQPAHMIPLGINPAIYPAAPLIRDIDLLGAGSLISLKQYDLFIRVTRKIAEKLPAVRAMICGDGPEKAALSHLIEDQHLQNEITLAGKLPHAVLLRTMQRSKILLHTSAYEGLGAVCLEALYAGAEVISFCRPFDAAIAHWHIVKNEEEMAEEAVQLLLDGGLEYVPVLPFEVHGIARRIIGLFESNHGL